jgi:DNA-binding HxlR family transcriptional regulator
MKQTKGAICPVAKTAELLSDTWTMLIIRDLLKGKMRFSELEKTLDGISSRTLTLKLKCLEAAEIVDKSDIYYTLTPQGKKLKSVIEAMEAWGKKAYV